jgi:C4-dicarboxylate-binding protein DctP
MKNIAYGLAAAAAFTTAAQAEDISLRIGSGHPPGVVYAGLMINFFQTEVTNRVAERTEHTVSFVEGYAGSIVTVTETLEGVQDGILDIGGMCFCFEPSNLPLHAFQVMLPFGTMDPVDSLQIAQDVYEQVPYLTEVFEEEYNQILLARIADGGYNLGTKFGWTDLAGLQGQKIGGAGINLNWLENAGIVPVSSSLATSYTEMTTGVYDGFIMFPSAWVNLKLYEPGPFYTLIGFGSMTWHGMTMNKDSYDRLPPEVQEIIVEVAAEFEELTGTENKEQYDVQIQTLRDLITVTEIDASVRQEWAESLQPWVQKTAADLEGQGLPAKEVMALVLDGAEGLGYEWPVRYALD